MLIPSIDLQGGKVVQLVRGERVALSYDDPGPWIAKFSHFQRVQLIDLDAAKGVGNNRELMRQIAAQLPVQIGGGIRTPADARAMLDLGASAVIVGSALFGDTGEALVKTDVAQTFAQAISPVNLIFGIDTKGGKIAVRGWRTTVPVTPEEGIRALELWCGAFLYTHVDTEGTLTGFPVERAKQLSTLTHRRLIVAGGIRTMGEVTALDVLGVDAVVGMAIYRGLI